MTTLAPFHNGEFAIVIAEHPNDGFHVQAPGLARALGFREAFDLLRTIPDEEKGSELVRTPGGEQVVGYLTEAGFYRALGQRQAARIPDEEMRGQVERFQSWVYRDVLPSLRRGSSPAAMTDREKARALALAVIAESDRADVAEAKVAELAPAAEAWNYLASATGDFSLRDAAQMLNRDPRIDTGQNRLMKTLEEFGMVDTRGRPYQRHAAHLRRKPVTYEHPNTHEPVLTSQIRVTADGLRYLHKRLTTRALVSA